MFTYNTRKWLAEEASTPQRTGKRRSTPSKQVSDFQVGRSASSRFRFFSKGFSLFTSCWLSQHCGTSSNLFMESPQAASPTIGRSPSCFRPNWLEVVTKSAALAQSTKEVEWMEMEQCNNGDGYLDRGLDGWMALWQGGGTVFRVIVLFSCSESVGPDPECTYAIASARVRFITISEASIEFRTSH